VSPPSNRDHLRIRRALEARTDRHPAYADLHNQLGLLLAESGDLERAEKHLLKAIRLNGRYREAQLNLAFLYGEGGREADAEKKLRPLAGRNAADAFPHLALGVVLHLEGKAERAARHLGRAAELNPEYAKTCRIIGEAASKPGERRQRVLRKVLGEWRRAHLLDAMGLHLAQEGRSAPALRAFRRAGRLKPDDALLHGRLGYTHYVKGKFSEAAREYRAALKREPRDGAGYASLGYVYGAMKETRKALLCLKKAVALSPGYADLHYSLALLYSDRGRKEEAVSELRKAVRLNPGYLLARINLGVLYEELGRPMAARKEYEAVLHEMPDDLYVRDRLERIQ
jgi:tetratricopeptide (TPR) repeat protein